MIERLADHPSTVEPEPFAGPDHPMRMLTRAVALGEPWTTDDADRVAAAFDAMAAGWTATHVDDVKLTPVRDAFDRGQLLPGGRWLELGSGTGAGTRVLAERVEALIATDLAMEMLQHAPGDLAPRVRADANRLPFPDDAFDGVLMVNMLLFPEEVDRVLRPHGGVVWVNTLGDQTPIHLPVEEVVRALPGDWSAHTARAGSGFWATLRRRR